MRRIFAAAMFAFMSPAMAAAQPAERDGVYVVGGLHRLHEQEESFDYEQLRRLVVAIDPDIVILEVRPDELAERKDTGGRSEYPAVIWPLLDEQGYEAVAMEPGGDDFAQMVENASRLFSAFKEKEPEKAAWLAQYREAMTQALLERWRTPADTQDNVTDELMRGLYVVNAALRGPKGAASQENWDAYMIDIAEKAIRNNPEKKILILGSYRNRHAFIDALNKSFPDRLVDMAGWLRDNSEAVQ